MTDTIAMRQLKGRTALVTGGTDGIGQEIARGLAQRGARLVIVGCDADKGARAEQYVRTSSNNSEVEFVQADLSLMREAVRLADVVSTRWPELNYLVHSAGIVRGRRVPTSEGIESNFATNYLSRFASTTRLLPTLKAAGSAGKAARILLVSHPGFAGTIHYDDVNLTKNFSTIRAFRQFHFANDLFAVELDRRLTRLNEAAKVTISCLHPGPTKNTGIVGEMPFWMKLMLRSIVIPLAAHTPDVPAAAALRLILDDEYEGEAAPFFSLVGTFKRGSKSPEVLSHEARKRLWDLSEERLQRALATEAAVFPALDRVRTAAE